MRRPDGVLSDTGPGLEHPSIAAPKWSWLTSILWRQSHCSDKGTPMQAEPVRGLSAPIPQGRKDLYKRNGNEEAIQACYDQLPSGPPLSEILDTANRLQRVRQAKTPNHDDY